jgi:hypothetical protein
MLERFAAVALVACTLVLVLVGLRNQNPGPCAANTGPGVVGLCIAATDLKVKAGSEVAIQTQVTNVTASPIKGKTWWVVAPLGSGPPWVRSIFQSSADVREYTAGSTSALQWDVPLTLPSGFYDVGVIVHRVNADGSELHSDWRYVGPIHLAMA